MTTRTVTFTLPGYMHPEYVEDTLDPVWLALQLTPWTLAADGETVITGPLDATDPCAVAFRASPAIEHEVAS